MTTNIERLKAGRKNTRVVKFPGTDLEVMLRIVSGAEIQEAVFAAENRFKAAEIAVTSSTYDAYEDERTTQLLFRQLRDPLDVKKPFAASADELRAALTKEEKTALVELYEAFENETSPRLAKMSEEDFETLWEALKKSPEIVSSSLNSAMLKRLLLYSASRPSSSPTDSGSSSSE